MEHIQFNDIRSYKKSRKGQLMEKINEFYLFTFTDKKGRKRYTRWIVADSNIYRVFLYIKNNEELLTPKYDIDLTQNIEITKLI